MGGQKVAVPISLVAAIPGDYTGPASRAYRYYTDGAVAEALKERARVVASGEPDIGILQRAAICYGAL